jgi:hypothetical protein
LTLADTRQLEVFDEVSKEPGLAPWLLKVPNREKEEALAAFNAQKPDVTAGSRPKTMDNTE